MLRQCSHNPWAKLLFKAIQHTACDPTGAETLFVFKRHCLLTGQNILPLQTIKTNRLQ